MQPMCNLIDNRIHSGCLHLKSRFPKGNIQPKRVFCPATRLRRLDSRLGIFIVRQQGHEIRAYALQSISWRGQYSNKKSCATGKKEKRISCMTTLFNFCSVPLALGEGRPFLSLDRLVVQCSIAGSAPPSCIFDR